MKDICHESEQQGEDDEYYPDHFVLLLEVGHGAFPDILCDFFHGRGAFTLLLHLAVEIPSEKQGQYGCNRHHIEQIVHSRIYITI